MAGSLRNGRLDSLAARGVFRSSAKLLDDVAQRFELAVKLVSTATREDSSDLWIEVGTLCCQRFSADDNHRVNGVKLVEHPFETTPHLRES
jgi:hypothetical protein